MISRKCILARQSQCSDNPIICICLKSRIEPKCVELFITPVELHVASVSCAVIKASELLTLNNQRHDHHQHLSLPQKSKYKSVFISKDTTFKYPLTLISSLELDNSSVLELISTKIDS